VKETDVYLALGSNLGQRHVFLSAMKKRIHQRIGPVTGLSQIYETPPWGFEADQAFLNQVVVCSTQLPALEVLHAALDIEKQMGRKRRSSDGYSSRTADIDLLFFGHEILDHPRLVLPHPNMSSRRFVLEPLNELAPDKIHPVLLQSISALLDACPDNSPISTWPSPTDT
jgi:2-amino-4-hydroxy-6-hydroxymethyldihydropteridine diphosphokinase